uniref:Zinc finger protein 282 n=1 Tax=Sphenodon punctatus TaxID=8508 RepID=A0A8D0L4T7_SPHPU
METGTREKVWQWRRFAATAVLSPPCLHLLVQGLGGRWSRWAVWIGFSPPQCSRRAHLSPCKQIQEWNVEAQHLMPLQPPLVPELTHMREAQLHTAEASLWTVVATVQAMERKIDLLATRLLSLEGRSGTAEKKLLDCEKTAMEFGNQLESKWAVLGTLIQEYGLLQRRLENMENLLKNRNFWILRLPPGSKGEVPKVPVTFVDIAVYFSAEELKNLEEWQKELYNNLVKENYESLISLGKCLSLVDESVFYEFLSACPVSKPLISTPDILSRIKQEEESFAGGGQFSEERGIPTDPSLCRLPTFLPCRISPQRLVDTGENAAPFSPSGAEALISAHDFLSWIKQEEEPCVRGQWESAEREILTVTGPAPAPRGAREVWGDPVPGPGGIQRPVRFSPATGESSCEPTKPHGCSECGKTFGVKKSLKVHQRSHHGQERPYECTECRKSFNCHSGLVRHQMTHRGERPYKCEECGKCYSRKEHLQNHQRLHTGERPFQCAACGKRFIRKQNLLKHQRIHTGERPYQCAACGRSFRYKESLKDHLRTHNSEPGPPPPPRLPQPLGGE